MKRKKGFLALIITVLIWGTTMVVTKVALGAFSPMMLTFVRFMIAFLFYLPFALPRGYFFRLSIKPSILLLGFTGITLFFGTQNLGLYYTSAASGSIILAAVPAVITGMAIYFLNERPSRIQLLGIGLTVIGIIVVSLGGSPDIHSPNPLLGNVILIVCVLAWGAYTIQIKQVKEKLPALVLTTAVTGAGLLFLLPMMIGEWLLVPVPGIDGPGLAAAIYLGIAASGLSMLTWNIALREIPASSAAPYINLVPILGLVSAMLMGERLDGLQLSGAVLGLLGVWISSQSAHSH
jgi:drug/metabolite transporter (DMT)-like permease